MRLLGYTTIKNGYIDPEGQAWYQVKDQRRLRAALKVCEHCEED